MKTLTTSVFVFALLSGAVACSGGATNVQSTTAQSAATKAPLAVQVSGPLRGIADSFADVPLRPEQRSAIEGELKQAEDRHAKIKPLVKDAALLIADQIEKGTIDEAALQPKIDAAVAAFKPTRDEDRKAIQRVHDLLDADQRTALVDALDTKHHERFGKQDGKGRGGFHKIAEELNLSADQKAKIFEAMRNEALADGPEHAFKEGWGEKIEMKQRHEKAREAFKTDAFKIDEAAPAMDMEKGSKQMFEHGVRFAHAALPILTAEQRTTAARIIRERADMFEPR
jgi:uncharacterized membrane protein